MIVGPGASLAGKGAQAQTALLRGPDRMRVGFYLAYTNRAWVTAAAMKDVNKGCGSKGLDFSSGWN